MKAEVPANGKPPAGHTGYRVTVAYLDGNRVVDYEVLADGWLGANNIGWGRPVDVLVMQTARCWSPMTGWV